MLRIFSFLWGCIQCTVVGILFLFITLAFIVGGVEILGATGFHWKATDSVENCILKVVSVARQLPEAFKEVETPKDEAEKESKDQQGGGENQPQAVKALADATAQPEQIEQTTPAPVDATPLPTQQEGAEPASEEPASEDATSEEAGLA